MTADETWRPLSVRESGDTAAYDGPFEGVPDWLFDPLYSWIKAIIPAQAGVIRGAAVGEYQRLAMRLRITLSSNEPPRHAIPYEAQFYKLAKANPPLLLSAVDALLQELRPNSEMDAALTIAGKVSQTAASRIDSLGEILRLSGSVYRVQMMDGKTRAYLVRRVDPTTEGAFTRELERSGPTADHLAEAWRFTFGRNPSASEGYRQAIKAIESAAIPIICPTDELATLGKIIADIRAAPQKWELALQHRDKAKQMPALADWLDVIWKGQIDRHGSAEVVRVVTQSEAETAVVQAVSVVALFRDGGVRRITEADPKSQ